MGIIQVSSDKTVTTLSANVMFLYPMHVIVINARFLF